MKMLTRAALALLAALLCLSPASAQVAAYDLSADTVTSQCRHWTAITPSDSTPLTFTPKAIYVGGAGDVAMIGVDAPSGATGVTWKNVPASAMLPARPRQILATGTTATFLVACR